MVRPCVAAALAALLIAPAPAAAQQAQRVCTPLIHVIGSPRVGEARARQQAIEDFDARLIRQFGSVNPYSAHRGLNDGTLSTSCRRDGGRQSCSITGTICVLSQAVPLCREAQRVDVTGHEDTCLQDPAPIPQRTGAFAPSIAGGVSFRGPIPCPRGYQRRVQPGPDHCRLPGY